MDMQVEGTVVEQEEGGRKLATIRQIDTIRPIPGADAIEVATVGGWEVVVKKGEFNEGDLALYLEIDSWVPNELAPFLSRGHEPRVYNGVAGERLRTIKLRGQLSQGLLLPISGQAALKVVTDWIVEQLFPATADPYVVDNGTYIGADLTKALNVQKWERPISSQLQGKARGNFPSFIRKTDQERCQNLTRQIAEAYENEDIFEISRKMDGSSMTVYFLAGHEPDGSDNRSGVCSRNLELKLDQEGNTFVDTAKKLDLLAALEKYGKNLALQGELVGPGIQGNSEGLESHDFYLFDIWLIDEARYATPSERRDHYSELLMRGARMPFIPVIDHEGQLPSGNVRDLLAMAEGKTFSGQEREGLVFKRIDGKFSFKAISNAFLLKGGD